MRGNIKLRSPQGIKKGKRFVRSREGRNLTSVQTAKENAPKPKKGGPLHMPGESKRCNRINSKKKGTNSGRVHRE